MTCHSRKVIESGWFDMEYHAHTNCYYLSRRRVHTDGYIEGVYYYVYADRDGRKYRGHKSSANGYPATRLPKKFSDYLRAYATLKLSTK